MNTMEWLAITVVVASLGGMVGWLVWEFAHLGRTQAAWNLGYVDGLAFRFDSAPYAFGSTERDAYNEGFTTGLCNTKLQGVL